MENTDGFIRLLDDFTNIRLCLRALRDTHQSVLTRQKTCRIFSLVYNTVKVDQNKILYAQTQLLRRIRTEHAELNQRIETLQNSRTHIELELNLMEDHMNSARDHAQQRRDKRNKREHQYNQAYFVPLVSNYWQKKYLRARDKNATAEQMVCEMRDRIEQCREELREIGRELGKIQKLAADLDQQKGEAEATTATVQEFHQKLSQANIFWSRFAGGTCQDLITTITDLVSLLERPRDTRAYYNDVQAALQNFVNMNNDYHAEEGFGQDNFGTIELDYTCSRCSQSQHGWPCVDKVRNQDLLCPTCYKETRLSMVVEKKVNAIGVKLLGSETSLSSMVDIKRRSVPMHSASSNNLRRKSAASDMQSIQSADKPLLKRNFLKSMFNISSSAIHSSNRISSFHTPSRENVAA
ncbi:hypothetical protein K450DRAFT_240604 [Umbelopsis ramanniana AG]|uniref:Uncharacterized protein n=1 Tax=Umbelopsis ramanniana AG TaxID=1314678 RepID=A0AAD5E9J8_UMBRA|nr:uncharacterized protein K450DRAFT_240604 [Umbelopsis ramanniana AG]KAI8579846.1 hypothetical protein K450DRAFT_240604 [Umbelopsis ramanniana AG]